MIISKSPFHSQLIRSSIQHFFFLTHSSLRGALAIAVLSHCHALQAQAEPSLQDKEMNYELEELDSYYFRRAYHGHDTLAEQDLAFFMERDPEALEVYEQSGVHPFYTHCLNAGILYEGALRLNAIDTLPEHFELKMDAQQVLQVHARYADNPKEVDQPSLLLEFAYAQRVLHFDTLECNWPPDVTIWKRDLDLDGSEEILIVQRWYIINGDNFDLKIYRLKRRD